MNTTFKSLFFLIASALMISVAVFVIASTSHVLNTAATTNTISFAGEGKILAKPDIAVLNLSVVTEGTTSKLAQDANTTKSNLVVSFLKTNAVAEKDIKTTAYNIAPTYSYPQFGSPRITGYSVNETLEVKIHDLTNVNTILDGVVGAGVNQVNQLSFQVDNPDKLKADARKQAIDNAQMKASELQSQLGISLGKIVNFSESTDNRVPVPMYAKTTDLGMGGGPVGPDVQAGENEITVDVSLTYQIK